MAVANKNTVMNAPPKAVFPITLCFASGVELENKLNTMIPRHTILQIHNFYGPILSLLFE